MKKFGKQYLFMGSILLFLFVVWTFLVLTVDVQAIGPNESYVGFATLNGWFHKVTGVHLLMYTITDWLGLVPIFVCMVFVFASAAVEKAKVNRKTFLLLAEKQ